jgi:hypothetical protein
MTRDQIISNRPGGERRVIQSIDQWLLTVPQHPDIGSRFDTDGSTSLPPGEQREHGKLSSTLQTGSQALLFGKTVLQTSLH